MLIGISISFEAIQFLRSFRLSINLFKRNIDQIFQTILTIGLKVKCLKKFKASRLNIDEQLYKEAKINVQKLIKNKKRDFYQEKLRENVGKPKELWKALKSLGLPSKMGENLF